MECNEPFEESTNIQILEGKVVISFILVANDFMNPSFF